MQQDRETPTSQQAVREHTESVLSAIVPDSTRTFHNLYGPYIIRDSPINYPFKSSFESKEAQPTRSRRNRRAHGLVEEQAEAGGGACDCRDLTLTRAVLQLSAGGGRFPVGSRDRAAPQWNC